MNKFFTFLLPFFGLFKMIKYLRLLPCLLLGFLNVSSQNLKLRLNTSLVITILFFCIAFDGYSQNCAPRINTNSGGTRFFLQYNFPAAIGTVGGTGTCLTAEDAFNNGIDSISVDGGSTWIELALQAGNNRLRSVSGTYANPNPGPTTIIIGGIGGESCTYEGGLLDVPAADAGIDGVLCENDLANPPVPTEEELFGALDGTPDTGGAWSNVGRIYTYTVMHSYFPCIIDEAEVLLEEECFCYPTTRAAATATPGEHFDNTTNANCDIDYADPTPADFITPPVFDCDDATAVTYMIPVFPKFSVFYQYWGNCSTNSPTLPGGFSPFNNGFIQQFFCEEDGNGLPAFPVATSETGSICFLPAASSEVGTMGFTEIGDCINSDPNPAHPTVVDFAEAMQFDFWLAVPAVQSQIGFQIVVDAKQDGGSLFVGPDLASMCEVAYNSDGSDFDALDDEPIGTYNVDPAIHDGECGHIWLRVREYITDINDRFDNTLQANIDGTWVDLSTLNIVAATSADDDTPPTTTLAATTGYLVENAAGDEFIFDGTGTWDPYGCLSEEITEGMDEGVCMLTLLPVELTSFDALLNNKQVTLKWETAAEVNNAGFEIQKSLNGRDWEILGWVDGNGTTAETTTYEYIDRAPFAGDNYYRLKQVDYDGQFEFSDIATVRYKVSSIVVEISPNPSPGEVNVRVLNPRKEKMSIKLYDSAGLLIWQSGTLANVDTWKKKFNLAQKEMYFLSVQVGKESFAKKILIIDKF